MLIEWLRSPAGLADARPLDDARPGLALCTPGLRRVATLPALLSDWRLLTGRRPAECEAVLAWGHRPSADVARRHAERHGLALLRAEDGFLRSSGLGHASPPLSIAVDDLGLYLDASGPSRLEQLIAAPAGAAQRARGARLREQWVRGRLSKYNHAPDRLPEALRADAPRAPVLVVDQTAGDASIAGALADAARFRAMLEAALDEHPDAPIWLKVHPDVIAGRKAGHFGRLPAGAAARVRLVADDVHPPALFEVCRAVHVVSSQMGFEALLHGLPVRCFGMPFYAGWGLTDDAVAAPERRRLLRQAHPDGGPCVDALAHAALVAHPRCIDPETGRRCEPERLVAHLALQRAMRSRLPAQVAVAGFSRWKRPIAQAFLQGCGRIDFVRRPSLAQGAVAVWGRRPAPQPAHETVLRIEDGFLRSVGLGADLVRPVSWVIDDLGIYFDATRPSRLEHLLAHHAFDAALRERAGALRRTVVASNITKYNVGSGGWRRPQGAARVVLVPGQVETDASIRWGAGALQTNADLLRAAREAEPRAHLVYKPHPDVIAGLRQAGRDWQAEVARLRAWCDEVVVDAPMHALLAEVDAVHTLTSLTGFEALLRGREVVTWGVPFYAGWGLTDDRAPADHPAFARRGRRLDLDELVAATLILYPTYVSHRAGAYTTPEQALAELRELQRAGVPTVSPLRRLWRAARRQALQALARHRGI